MPFGCDPSLHRSRVAGCGFGAHPYLLQCLAGVLAFRSASKVLCLDSGKLTASGSHRWSRNPQYLGWFLFLLGFALTDWSLWCLAALLVVAASLHLLVLIEEEHLRRVFGEPYREYCRRVPRYCSNALMALISSASIPGSMVTWPAFSTMTSLDWGSFLWSL